MSKIGTSCVLLVLSLSVAAAFLAPTSSGLGLRLKASQSCRTTGLHGSARKGKSMIAMKATPEEEARFRAAEDAEIARRRAEDIENEKRYIQQSSGLNYRQNEQDGLIFVMGALIVLIPIVAVGIAISTGYVPLDYLR